jgi:putative transposase
VVKPQGRRRLVSFLEQTFGLSRRRACALAGISRSVVEYQPKRASDDALRGRILALARDRPRYGYRRIHVLLGREAGRATARRRTGSTARNISLDFPPWSLMIIATLDGFNDMDSTEVFRWQRDGFEVCG